MTGLSIGKVTIGEGIPKIIVPLMGINDEQILEEVEYVKSLKPDIIEWRVDVYEQVDDPKSVSGMIARLKEVICDELLLFTFRSLKEGGAKEISDGYYEALLQTAIETRKIDLVDVELFTGDGIVKNLVEAAKDNGVYVIMSNHDFHQTPPKEEILSRLIKMKELGAHIPKIALMPNSVKDVLTLLDATNTMKKDYGEIPIITMSMAGTGLISRLACEVFGSVATFGSGKQASAPGQIPVNELRDVLKIIHHHTK